MSGKEQDNSDSESNIPSSKLSLKFSQIMRALGPGLITGAADDDPSGIATYSQAGAKFGLGMLWTTVFLLPTMIVIQEMCARIGLLSGNGLAALIKKKYSAKAVYPISSLLVIANTINIGADLGAMSASVNIIFPEVPFLVTTILFSVFIIVAEIFIPYDKYVRVLKYLVLSLFAYVLTAIIVGGNIEKILFTIIPSITFSSEYAIMFVAVIGTTISPYLLFWQTSEEAEEDVAKHKIKEIGEGKPKVSPREIMLMKEDIGIGMFFSQFIMWSIIITSAGSLYFGGMTDIQTADQAASSLEPLVKSFPNSGQIAKLIFAFGIIGTGLLAIPVLSASSAFALSDTFGWKEGLEKKFSQAKAFYSVIAVSTLIGVWITFSQINPIQVLILAAVINAVVTIPILFIVMRLANDKKILKDKINTRFSNITGWFTFSLMTISVIVMFVSYFIWS
ncbi:MAG TPA: divalent metal cation transporter [Nitrososphaeraceae archaeon]|nr:divalent metal cation transporter [Nitrososphaeraceae archaeon]